ncbi:MAG: uracil phosphoribosyltransferase [bacterium]|nr:uracil phosphoribosyltransferase [bacterium]
MAVIEVKHALLADCLARLRDAREGPAAFREALRRAALLLLAEALRDLPLRARRVYTPLGRAACRVLPPGRIVAVPILRAGLGMLGPILDLVPSAAVGFIGLKRDEETFEPAEYHRSLPRRLAGKTVVILDPMLATGGSLSAAIDLLRGRGAADLRAVTLVAAPEGIRRVARRHPGVRIYTAAVDRRLNRRAYIVPGIGDAGDRMFGTV